MIKYSQKQSNLRLKILFYDINLMIPYLGTSVSK